MISAQTLPLVLPEIPQDLNSGDSGLNMLLCAERLISHYGSFDLTGPDTCKPKKTNEIFSFFQFSENAANELRSEILRVMNMLSGESENRYAEFAGFDADDINFDLLWRASFTIFLSLCWALLYSFLHLFLFFDVLLNFDDLLIVDLAVMDLFPFLKIRLVSFIFCQLWIQCLSCILLYFDVLCSHERLIVARFPSVVVVVVFRLKMDYMYVYVCSLIVETNKQTSQS